MGTGVLKDLRLGSLLFIGGAVLAIGAAVWYMAAGGDSASESARARELRSRKLISGVKGEKTNPRALPKRERKNAEKVAVKTPPVKPDFLSDLDEDRKMTAEMKKMFLELQAALDLEDAKKVYALVHKLQLMDEWPDGIPRAVKLKALDALSWFGASGMSEAVGFLADSDPTVRQESLSKFEEMLTDWDLGDTGISAIIKQVVKVVHDKDALDAFYYEMNNMRPTVKAETALAIYDSQNPDAISVLNANLDFTFESDGEIKNRADVEKYLADAKEAYEKDPAKAAEDEEFYGPPKK